MRSSKPVDFTGRGWVFARLEAFLRGPPGVFLLVGAPGTGKTAIAEQLVRTAAGRPTPAAAAASLALRVDAAYFCRAGQVDLVDVAQRLSDQLATAIPEFAQERANRLAPQIEVHQPQVRTGPLAPDARVSAVHIDLGALEPEQAFQRGVTTPLSRLREAGNATRVVLLVDGLDEALAFPTSTALPALLAAVAQNAHVVVTARNDVQATGSLRDQAEAQVVDLVGDAPADSDDDVYRYLQRRLEPHGPALAMDLLARRIARKAAGNFLYAVHLVEGFRQEGLLADLNATAVDRVSLPEGLPRLYRDFLRRQLWRDEQAWANRFRPLVALLAVAQDEGLDTQQLARAVSHLRGQPVRPTLVRDAVREAKQFVNGLLPDGPFRLYHQSFAEFLIDTQHNPDFLVDPDEAHQAMVTTYTSTDPLTWDRYGRRNVAGHAAQIGKLGTLLDRPDFLVVADPDRLLALLPSVTRHGSSPASLRLLRRIGPRLRGRQLGERAAVLELGARQLGAGQIANSLADLQIERPWSVRWAHQHPVDYERILGWHEGQVQAVAVTERAGRSVVVSGGTDGMVRAWDLRTGDPLLGWPHGDGEVETLAVGQLADGPIVVSGGSDRRLQRWNLSDGTPIGPPLAGHRGGISSVAVGDLAGRPIIVSGGKEESAVRIWDLGTGRLLHVLESEAQHPRARLSGSVRAVATGSCFGQPVVIAGHNHGAHLWAWTGSRWVGKALFRDGAHTVWAVAVGVLDGRPVAVCGDNFGRVTTWDLETGERAEQPLKSPDLDVVGVAAGEFDGRAIAVTGSYFGRDPGMLRVWDLGARTLRGSLVGHQAGVKALAITRLEGGPFLVSGGFDRAVRVWDLAASLHGERRPVEHRHVSWLLPCRLAGRAVVVSKSAVSQEADRDHAAAEAPPSFEEMARLAGRSDNARTVVQAWDRSDGAPIGVGERDLDHLGHVRAVGNVADKALGATWPQLYVRDLLGGGRASRPIPTDKRFDPASNIAVGQVQDRAVVAFCDGNGELQVWDIEAARPVWEPLPTHGRGSVCRAVGTAVGRPIAAVALVGKFGVWDLERRQLLAKPPTMQRDVRVVNSPAAVGELAGHPVIVCSRDGQPILVWEITQARELAIEVDASISAIAIAPDSTILAGGPAGLLALRVQGSFFRPTPSEGTRQ